MAKTHSTNTCGNRMEIETLKIKETWYKFVLNSCTKSDGYVNVNDLLNLNFKTFANIPLRSHTIDDIRETSFARGF
ncbi:hypothetical protein MTR_2g029020 [Medicago truncatula]|uniref:Uncharacterized protein n=1 Tax=Medicago truncatula TaxID=3880 RepID=G7IJR8_MEDTR|nr:hypothetical protein MTR_2g029020 [Medicago truncatula]